MGPLGWRRPCLPHAPAPVGVPTESIHTATLFWHVHRNLPCRHFPDFYGSKVRLGDNELDVRRGCVNDDRLGRLEPAAGGDIEAVRAGGDGAENEAVLA